MMQIVEQTHEEKMAMYMRLPKKQIIEMLIECNRMLSFRSEQCARCPICGGNGIVPNGFYIQTSGTWTSGSTDPETCKSCNGTGVIKL